jgi:ABC-2 type transport system ATP-binding protein/sodium transport system ATP-binding protein
MIRASQLLKRFHVGQHTILAVNRVTFQVAAGEVYGLLGPNGAGKTTTLRMILGLIQPDEGMAEVDGYETAAQPDLVKSRVGCVTANDGIYPWLSVREMLIFFADLYGISPAAAKRNVDRLSELFGMQAFIDRRAISLSTGQKQRAALARALVHDPSAVLLDEPTRGLDVIGSQVVVDYISHLRREGKSVILSTHRLDEAERLCDRFGLLHEGVLRYEGTLEEIRRNTGCDRLADVFQRLTRAVGGGSIMMEGADAMEGTERTEGTEGTEGTDGESYR